MRDTVGYVPGALEAAIHDKTAQDTDEGQQVQKRNQPGRERAVAVEDVVDHDLLADDLVDDEYLREVLREPRRYLPPPRPRTRTEPEPEPEEPRPESAFERRAKFIALVIASLLVVASIVAAALLTSNDPAANSNPAALSLSVG